MVLTILISCRPSVPLQLEERDLVIGNVYRKLMEIESRLLPCGLHVVGIMPTAAEAVATLVNIGEINRPDNNPPVKVQGLCMCCPTASLHRCLFTSEAKACPSLTPSVLLVSRCMLSALTCHSKSLGQVLAVAQGLIPFHSLLCMS